MFHCVTAAASAVAGGAAEAPMTPSPARTATSAATSQMDHLCAMSAPSPFCPRCYGLPLSCSACGKITFRTKCKVRQTFVHLSADADFHPSIRRGRSSRFPLRSAERSLRSKAGRRTTPSFSTRSRIPWGGLTAHARARQDPPRRRLRSPLDGKDIARRGAPSSRPAKSTALGRSGQGRPSRMRPMTSTSVSSPFRCRSSTPSGRTGR